MKCGGVLLSVLLACGCMPANEAAVRGGEEAGTASGSGSGGARGAQDEGGLGGATRWGISFPPVSSEEQLALSREHLAALGVRHIRFAEHWSEREPERGRYAWGPMDRRMRFVDQEGYSLLLTIESNGPGWACGEPSNERSCVYSDLQAFRAYVRALLERYRGKIDKIQFGNEWQTAYWYAGGARDFVAANNVVYEETKRVSPDTQVVLGGFSIGALHVIAASRGRVERFHDAEGKQVSGAALERLLDSDEVTQGLQRIRDVVQHARYDLVDLHLYDDVENWPTYVELMRELVPKPVLVSEFGGPHQLVEEYSDEYQAQCLRRYMETLAQLDIPEAYFFKLVESHTAQRSHVKSSLLDAQRKVKPSYAVFRELSRAAEVGGR